MRLTDEQLKIVASILPEDTVRADGRGRPWSDRRKAFEGALWILRTGAPWQDLPLRYGAYQAVPRRFQNWVRSGVMERILLKQAEHLREVGGLDLKECFVAGTFVPAKRGGVWLGKPNAAKAPRSWALQTATVFLSPCGQKALRLLK